MEDSPRFHRDHPPVRNSFCLLVKCWNFYEQYTLYYVNHLLVGDIDSDCKNDKPVRLSS